MKNKSVGKTVTRSSKLVAAFLAVGIALLPAADARAGSSKPKVDVVAHTKIPGGAATRMLLVKAGAKRFLLLGFSSRAGVEVLDVTDTSQPRALDTQSGASPISEQSLEIVAASLSVFGDPTAETSGKRGTVPEEIQRFSGVKMFVIDKERQLIYLSDNEGLWIVKTNRKQRFDDDQAKAAELYGG